MRSQHTSATCMMLDPTVSPVEVALRHWFEVRNPACGFAATFHGSRDARGNVSGGI